MSPRVSIVIPAYNGKPLLEANLPPLLAATQGVAGLEVIVVDDGSADGTAEFLAGRFPEVSVVALGTNRGFAAACNAGVHASKGDVVYFLNTDVRVSHGFLEPVVSCLGDPAVFAVGSRELPPAGEETLRLAVPFFRFGLLGHRYVDTREVPREPIPVAFVSAGHAAFSREKFLALGGFDDLYRPFYWEDIDLCYRAWRRRWRVLVEPRSAVHHAGQGTIGRFYPRRTILSTYWKNRFLFIWKNLRDAPLVAEHLACLPLLIVGLPLLKGRPVLVGFARAVRQLREALDRRRREAGGPTMSDRQILALFAEGSGRGR